MDMPEYIVALAGNDELHARADRYNKQRSLLGDLKSDLETANDWNRRERFGSGFFASTKPPIPTADIAGRIESLRVTLQQERAEISRLSNGSIRP
jgi:hypothetical protein